MTRGRGTAGARTGHDHGPRRGRVPVWGQTDTSTGVVWVLARMPHREPVRSVGGVIEKPNPEAVMPFVSVKVIEGVFTTEQKQQIVERVTDAMVSVEGENMRPVTWVVIDQ